MSQGDKSVPLRVQGLAKPASGTSSAGISSIKRRLDATGLDDEPSTKALTPPSIKQKTQPALNEDSLIRGGLGDTSTWAHRSLATYKHELPYLREDYRRMNLGVNYDMLVAVVLGGCVGTAREIFAQRVKPIPGALSTLHDHVQTYMKAGGEPGLYAPFRDFANELFRLAELPFCFIDTSSQPRPNDRPGKSDPKRKPDIVMIYNGHITAGEDLVTIDIKDFPWSKVVVCMEFKYDKKRMGQGGAQKKTKSGKSKPQVGFRVRKGDDSLRSQSATVGDSMRSEVATFRTGNSPELQEQLAAYAIEMFSARGIRRHVLGLWVNSLSVEFWYYDRSAGYGSTPLSFRDNWEPLAILLLAIGSASAEQLGFEPNIRPPFNAGTGLGSSILIKAEGARIPVNGTEYVVEDEKLGRLRSLTGRGTAVFKVEATEDQTSGSKSVPGGLVIKLSWQLKDRRSEVDILRRLREREVPGVPYVVSSEDLARMRDGMHGRVQAIMGLSSDTDDRIYRAIIMKPRLEHLTTIGEWTMFFELFKGLINVHRDVYLKAQILHRDINPENLMVKKESDGNFVPFLIDYDFAVVVASGRDGEGEEVVTDDRIRTHRTMATPFLAMELLSDAPPLALYRYDLESFFWSLWWIAHSYLNGEQVKTDQLRSWYSGSWRDIRIAKDGYMRVGAVRSTNLTENMKDAKQVLMHLAELFSQAFDNVSQDQELRHTGKGEGVMFDRESAGGVVTWETFQACLLTTPT